MKSSLPVKARATRTAIITASVAELVKRTRSIDGVRAQMRSASSPCRAIGAGTAEASPWAAVRVIASTIFGCACPCTSGV